MAFRLLLPQALSPRQKVTATGRVSPVSRPPTLIGRGGAPGQTPPSVCALGDSSVGAEEARVAEWGHVSERVASGPGPQSSLH